MLAEKQKTNLLLIIMAGILSVIFWNIPEANYLLFPFNMFVTYLHEASHGLMAIITGGSLIQFQMQMDTSGVAYTSGGIRFLVISAGYLGSAFWGALLLMAAFRKGAEKPVLISLGIFFLIFTLLFARNLTAFSAGIIFSLIIFIILRLKHGPLVTSFLAFLAVQSCFHSINDIFTLIFLSSRNIRTDAHNMSLELTGGIVPPIIFAFIWLIISGIFFFIALRLSLGRLYKRKIKNIPGLN